MKKPTQRKPTQRKPAHTVEVCLPIFVELEEVAAKHGISIREATHRLLVEALAAKELREQQASLLTSPVEATQHTEAELEDAFGSDGDSSSVQPRREANSSSPEEMPTSTSKPLHQPYTPTFLSV